MERVPFFYPPTLALLYGIFKLHHQMYPTEQRSCQSSTVKSAETDVNRYVQRVNFFKCCPEFARQQEEDFQRHDAVGRFVPITEIHSMENTDAIAQNIIKVIFSQTEAPGESEVKTALSELMDNALQHSASSIGCIVQTQLYRNNFVDGVILDCGMGIRQHLRGNVKISAQVTSDESALLKAIEPHISGTHNRKKDPERREDGYSNAGLGLSICCEIMKRTGGFLQLISGQSCVVVDQKGVRTIPIAGWPGTVVVFRMNYQKLASIADIIEEFDIQKIKGDNPNRNDPKFI
jgi:signal transduction histidine kinase